MYTRPTEGTMLQVSEDKPDGFFVSGSLTVHDERFRLFGRAVLAGTGSALFNRFLATFNPEEQKRILKNLKSMNSYNTGNEGSMKYRNGRYTMATGSGGDLSGRSAARKLNSMRRR